MQQILIVGASWVGDMVMSQTLFKVLHQKNPECAIDVLAPEWSLPLLERMPEVRQGIVMPLGHGTLNLSLRHRLGKSLRNTGYDQAIVLPNSLKSALVPCFAHIPVRTGWRGEWRYGLLNDLRLLDKAKLPLMMQRFAALGLGAEEILPETLPRPELRVNKENQQDLFRRFKLSADRKTLVLCPGAEFGAAKKWPESHYAALAATMISRHWQVWLLGSTNDRDVAEKIRECLPAENQRYCMNLAGQTSLVDVIDLIAAADAVVSNDSGLMHIAAALDRPLAVVYGSTSPGFTPPLSERAKVVSLNLPCSPCFKRECPLQHLNCLRQLEPARVIEALQELNVSEITTGDLPADRINTVDVSGVRP